MDTNLDVTGIIKRAKQVLGLKRDSELAEYLGVS
ncbi:bacteriophage CI repressor, partial [Bacteroides acidifaciens]